MYCSLSYASRPSRIFIKSDDAIDRSGQGIPSAFALPLIENILDAEAVQLLSCRIPNAIPQIPDYQRYFVYQYFDGAVLHSRAFMLDHAQALPSFEYYADYSALVAQLNIDNAYWVEYTGTPLTRADFVASTVKTPDVTFSYDSGTRQILMSTAYVAPAFIRLGSETVFATIIAFNEVVKNYLYLNFLLGFETRPILIADTATLPLLTATNSPYVPPSWANLIPTQTIYIQSNMVMNGTYTSNGFRNILQTIPVSVPTLGLITYQSSQRHYIYSVPKTIGTITIELLDDNLQPINLPENAQTEFEIGVVYKGEI